MKVLTVLMDGTDVGVLRQDRGRLHFTYADGWRARPGSYPLSLSMPLAAADHAHAALDPFLWGLLPDNAFILSQWGKRFHVSPRDAFALLAHVGEDCAGAVQFVRPDRREELTGRGQVDWLSEAEIATRLRDLETHADAWRTASDTGQFSLAGAQPKTALLFDGRRWGVPSGRVPTTHILKPPAAGLDGHVMNEHLCLSLARALGLPAADTKVVFFEDAVAIAIERYDRVITAPLAEAAAAQAAAKAASLAIEARVMSDFSEQTPIYRVHQEDFCQALRVHPAKKYQNDGGPSARAIVDLLRANASRGERRHGARPSEASDEDIVTFLDALAFNWLIGGTDAHAKNYSILLGGFGLARLAPLYDVSSIFAYRDLDPRKAKLAMSVGGTYLLHDIGYGDWTRLAAEMRLDPDRLIGRIRGMAAELPDRLSEILEGFRQAKLSHPAIDRLGRILPDRASKVARL